jgi:SNF2 family DNA or RNA helicase
LTLAIEPPKDFKPWGYQGILIDHIIENPRCAGWVFMGAGKTVSTYTALDTLDLSYSDVYPAIVFAPLRVAKNTWPREVRKWKHLQHINVMAICGGEKERIAAMRFDAQIYTCNYENLEWLVEFWGDKWPYKTVVCDESTRCKSFRLKQGGKRMQALSKVAHAKVKRFIELSGTPAPNGLKDLWGQLWFIDIGARLGRTYEAFKQRWFQRSFDGYGIVPLQFASDQIHKAVEDVCLSIEAKDWFDLADPIVRNVYVDLPPKARVHYREMEKELFTQIEEHGVEAFAAPQRTMKCLQLASGAAYVNGSNKEWRVIHDAKIDALESIIEEANGMPVLVAYNFKSDLARLLKAFPQGRHLDAKQSTEDDWNAGKIPVLFAHPASAGHGLNLQFGGNILVYFSHWWNAEERWQILERIGPVRQLQAGLNRNVFVYNIIAEDTVDEDVIESNDMKLSVQDALLAATNRYKNRSK